MTTRQDTPGTLRPARPGTTTTDRVAAALLALTGATVGGWALLGPASFYAGFPGGGRSWVAPDGPFNEHLVRDVGALNLALAVLAVAALRSVDHRTARLAGVVWLVFAVPHLGYHAGHLAALPVADRVVQTVALAGVVLLAAVLCRPVRAGGAR
ncbi:hypothetical protein [Kineosporia sp. R_H_3]|uniref:hypothetical protein n=1 Tax=Kineosporia sp. R_H_3 TaxID=1961848 RepID=UPI0018E96805|nr:hypothetical protein [Kineosporia sp. R_H_3]